MRQGTFRVCNGLDRTLNEAEYSLANIGRFGLVMNQASLTKDGFYACDALAQKYPGQLIKLFSPQHGLWGEEQANMIETDHSRYDPLGLPLYSLYSQTREPTAEMLHNLDAVVIDLQDVGTRVYTFIWTMTKCMEACAKHGVRVIVLDRPNPLGGVRFEGPTLLKEYRSFVGLAEIPMRHGLTMGEVAEAMRSMLGIDCDLLVIPMEGWNRRMGFGDIDQKWPLPSPNMPTIKTTQVYPGGVLLEGTNLSEGRGTTIPFELIGAPYVDEFRLVQELNLRKLPGVRFRPTRFRPTFDKWKGESCRGVFLDILDLHEFDSYRSVLHVLHAIIELHPDQFAWLPPPYEYERVKPPIDILSGSDRLRCELDQGCSSEVLNELAATQAEEWEKAAQPFWLYDA